MTSPRPTPLTDAVWDDYVGGMAAAGIRVDEDDMLRHARQLERDRAELIEGLRALRTKMIALQLDLQGVFTFYAAHGMQWPSDNNWKSEADAADALLARLEKEKS